MDPTKLRAFGVAVVALCFAGCGAPFPTIKEKPKPVPTSTPISAAKAEPIKKETNVSFDSYSKEWPVNWQWVDPDFRYSPTGRDITGRTLKLTIPKGKDLTDKLRTSPRFVKAITGDFVIETHVQFRPMENFQGAGILIYQDDLNYVRCLRAFGGQGGGGSGIFIDAWIAGEQRVVTTTADLQTGADAVDIRVERRGSHIVAFWRVDDDSEWREAGEIEVPFPETIFAGLTASNTAREVTFSIPYIKLSPVPSK